MNKNTTAAQPLDLDKLEALALAWQNENCNHWYNDFELSDGISYEPAANFITGFSPATALALIAQARAAQSVQAGEAVDARRAASLGMQNQANFRAACARQGVQPSQELFSLWQDARATLAPVAAQQAAAVAAPSDEQSNVLPPFAAPAGQLSFDDATIEEAALKHVATDWHRISHLIPDYRCTEQFARLKAFAEELARRGRAQGGNTSTESCSAVAATTSEDARDAARYRWIRDSGNLPMITIGGRWYGTQHDKCLDLDAAIDAAMRATQQEGGNA